MRFASLGSGSRGNATIVSTLSTTILIDCGLSLKVLNAALNRVDLAVSDIDAVFITHEHSDHIKGLSALARKTAIPIYMTTGTALAADWFNSSRLKIVTDMVPIRLGCMSVTPVVVPHDAREPCQYTVEVANSDKQADDSNKKLGLLTDLGSVSAHVIDAYRDCDALVLECNHDIEMLQRGPYPPTLKSRVLGDWGHLSNCQARDLLSTLCLEDLQWLVLAHISQQNNSPQLALETIQTVFPMTENTLVADQDVGFDWLSIA